MTWSVWDILIVVLAVPQIALLVGVVMVVLKIIQGPVAGVAARGGDLAEKGLGVVEAGQNAFEANKVHLVSIYSEAKGIVDSVRVPDRSQSLPINYGSLRRGLTMFLTFRRGLGTLTALAKSKPAPPGPMTAAAKRAAERRSLADRLGLIPPAAKHVGRFMPYVRMAWSVRNQLRGR